MGSQLNAKEQFKFNFTRFWVLTGVLWPFEAIAIAESWRLFSGETGFGFVVEVSLDVGLDLSEALALREGELVLCSREIDHWVVNYCVVGRGLTGRD